MLPNSYLFLRFRPFLREPFAEGFRLGRFFFAPKGIPPSGIAAGSFGAGGRLSSLIEFGGLGGGVVGLLTPEPFEGYKVPGGGGCLLGAIGNLVQQGGLFGSPETAGRVRLGTGGGFPQRIRQAQ